MSFVDGDRGSVLSARVDAPLSLGGAGRGHSQAREAKQFPREGATYSSGEKNKHASIHAGEKTWMAEF